MGACVQRVGARGGEGGGELLRQRAGGRGQRKKKRKKEMEKKKKRKREREKERFAAATAAVRTRASVGRDARDKGEQGDGTAMGSDVGIGFSGDREIGRKTISKSLSSTMKIIFSVVI